MAVCPKCGATIDNPNSQFCPSCGATLTTTSSASAWRPPSNMGGASRGGRPLGITILAILAILGGLGGIGGGATLLAFGGLLASGGLLQALGAVALILGLVDFALAYGYWVGKGWAWTVGIVLSIISIIEAGVSIAYSGSYAPAIDIIIPIIILYYLTRPHVKVWFGKGVTSTPPPPP